MQDVTYIEGGVVLVLHRKIVELRKGRGITQEELAKRIGTTRSALSQYEIGTRNPDYETLQRIANFFDVTTDDLLGREVLPEPTKAQNEYVLRELIEKYGIDLSVEGHKEKLEQLIKIVFSDMNKQKGT